MMTEKEIQEIQARYDATHHPEASRRDRHGCMEDVPFLIAEVKRLQGYLTKIGLQTRGIGNAESHETPMYAEIREIRRLCEEATGKELEEWT